jgi:hypothetical protein
LNQTNKTGLTDTDLTGCLTAGQRKMTYDTVYDVGRDGYTDWWFLLCGIPALAAGLLVSLRPDLARRAGMLSSYMTEHRQILIARYISAFAVFWMLIAFSTTYGGYRLAAGELVSGQYSLEEGQVYHFSPMPKGGHGYESFCVGRTCFSYSDYDLAPGFRKTSQRGGPVKEGVQVRLAHVGNVILRVEIAR